MLAFSLTCAPKMTSSHLNLTHEIKTETKWTRSSATAEIARVGDRYAVQGHARLLTFVPIIESLYATSCW